MIFGGVQSASGLLVEAEAGAPSPAGGEELCCAGLHATKKNTARTRAKTDTFIGNLLFCVFGAFLKLLAVLVSRTPVTCMAGEFFSIFSFW